jgi:hypothetical protein
MQEAEKRRNEGWAAADKSGAEAEKTPGDERKKE